MKITNLSITALDLYIQLDRSCILSDSYSNARNKFQMKKIPKYKKIIFLCNKYFIVITSADIFHDLSIAILTKDATFKHIVNSKYHCGRIKIYNLIFGIKNFYNDAGFRLSY
jgi:hypothetical protein